MGRKSSLTPEQWVEIERRVVVDGESINSLSIEFGINESSIRRKIKPNKAERKNGQKPLQVLAHDKVQAEREVKRIAEQIAELPIARQQIVSDLAKKLTSISEHLAGAAEYGAMTAHRLAGIANSQVELVDDAEPEKSFESLKRISALTRLANESSEIGVNLLRANKDAVDDLNRREMDRGSCDTSISDDPIVASREYQRIMTGAA